MSEQQEKKNKTIAWITSIGIHGLLLLAFFLMMAWRAPNPPLPEYGIELNFGMDDQGGGEIQPETSPGAEEEATPEKVEEEQTETAQPEEEVKEEAVTEKVEEPVVSKVESPVVVKEEKKEPVKEVVKEKVVEAKPKVTPKEEIKKEVPKEVEVTEEKGTDAKKGDPTTSQGDDKGKTGDKGNPEGKPNAETVYVGKPGGGNNGDGIGLNMGGWTWATEPIISDIPENSDGVYEFYIECDENGDITVVRPLERGISPKAQELIKNAIQRSSLSRTEGKAPPISKGTVKYTIRSH